MAKQRMSLSSILRWSLKLLLLLALIGFLDFYLPDHEVVRILDADVKRMDRNTGEFITNQGAPSGVSVTRDVNLIQTVLPNGKPLALRNEDTGWGFPWYFKFDTENLQIKAKDLRSTPEDPIWVDVVRYGWRIEVFSMFPNAISLKRVTGPDALGWPWTRIIMVVLLVLGGLLLWRAWHLFLVRAWLPMTERLNLSNPFSGLRRLLGRSRRSRLPPSGSSPLDDDL
jgi:hypothetical protein